MLGKLLSHSTENTMKLFILKHKVIINDCILKGKATSQIQVY